VGLVDWVSHELPEMGPDHSLPTSLDRDSTVSNIFYSTPGTTPKRSETVKEEQAKTQTTGLESPVQWSVKQDDFFPYSDCAPALDGYFTSRTAFKRLERGNIIIPLLDRLNPCLLVQLLLLKQAKNSPYTTERALGVVQHHDAVSGTATHVWRTITVKEFRQA
jgi:hypothetical protein